MTSPRAPGRGRVRAPRKHPAPAAARGLASPRLRALARSGSARAAAGPVPGFAAEADPPEHCDLCGAEIPAEHRHVLELSTRAIRCACRPCSLLFHLGGSGAGRLKLIPDRRIALDGFTLSDLMWEGLRIPVEMAFFFRESASGRVKAFYPSPMGPTESALGLESWEEIERENPFLASMQPDVEALLVNRAGGRPGQWLVPIEDPYRLVALIRTRWRGFTGGREVWEAIDGFFAQLDARARRAPTDTDPPHERSAR